jgi:hypothetical protein
MNYSGTIAAGGRSTLFASFRASSPVDVPAPFACGTREVLRGEEARGDRCVKAGEVLDRVDLAAPRGARVDRDADAQPEQGHVESLRRLSELRGWAALHRSRCSLPGSRWHEAPSRVGRHRAAAPEPGGAMPANGFELERAGAMTVPAAGRATSRPPPGSGRAAPGGDSAPMPLLAASRAAVSPALVTARGGEAEPTEGFRNSRASSESERPSVARSGMPSPERRTARGGSGLVVLPRGRHEVGDARGEDADVDVTLGVAKRWVTASRWARASRRSGSTTALGTACTSSGEEVRWSSCWSVAGRRRR